ncbi:1093_t:CDS:2, partial [Scutellospora calospora]
MTNLAVSNYESFANYAMPQLGYEVEDFQYYTWEITNWTNLDNYVTSPEFFAGGLRWRILLYPSENDYVSIYLGCVPNGAPNGWHSCAQFALVLWNPNEPTLYDFNHTYKRFTADETNWGYPQFCQQRDLFVPKENKTRPLIENNRCNITVLIRIIKDQTGFLWHNFTNYDSKKETGHVILKNQGTTGYLNAALQLLFSITSFRKAVYQIPTENDDPTKSVPLAVQRTFYQMQISDISVETTELITSFGWDSLNYFMQHDIHEFSRVLQNNLEEKMKSNADNAISKLFAGKMKSYIKCINVDYESSRVEDYYDIQLNVRECKNLDDSFMNYIQEEILEGNN